MKLPAALLPVLAAPAFAALEVVEMPHPNAGPTTAVTVNVATQGQPVNQTTATLQRVASPTASDFAIFNVNSTGVSFFRSSATPPAPAGTVASSTYYKSSGSVYEQGAQQGSDNWLYVTKPGGAKSWAQLELNTTTATVLRYVHDPANPTADISLADAVAAVNGPPPGPRDIQIRSVDFTTGIIELKNYGSGTIDLSGWRFCSHNASTAFRYTLTGALNGRTIASGASLFIHFNNDASGPNAINRSALGSFATPLTSEVYALGLYFQTPFGTGSNIADHLQWSHGGIDNENADARSSAAQAGGVWTDQSSWIVTSAQTERIILTDTANGVLHGPDDYLRLPDFGITGFQYIPAAGDVVINFPAVNNLVVDVQKANNLATDDWSTVLSTSASSAVLDDETDPEAYYRIVPQIP